MKKGQIIIVLVIAVCVGFIISTMADSSTYADFEEAFSNPGTEYHVVGEWVKSSGVQYAPDENPNLTTFQMKDRDGVVHAVNLYKAKPQDFERSESIVLIGKADEDGIFHANEILMKCPSKYNEQNQLSEI